MNASSFRQIWMIRQLNISFKHCLRLNQCRHSKIVKLQQRDFVKSFSASYATNQNFPSITKETGYGSKYHPMSPLDLTEERMREKFFQTKSLTPEQWEEIKTELMEDFLLLTETNFDSVIMNTLLNLNNYPLAASFMQYLKHTKRTPNFVTCLKYMSLCSRNVNLCKQETILETFDKIKAQVCVSPVLDNLTVDCIIQGLCATERWEESFEYLEKLPENNPKIETKNALTCAALNNGNIDMAWDMLNNWYSTQECPGNHVMKQYMKLVTKTFYLDQNEAELLLEKLFHHLVSKNIIMKMSLVDDIANFFKMAKGKWTIHNAKVNRDSICSGCGKTLSASGLSVKDFMKLREAFYEKSVKKVDVFFNTTDQELKTFLRFIEKHKPFDIVLDGLNAAHSIIGNKNRKTLAVQLLRVVRSLSTSYRRILVLGRKHMRDWPFHVWEQIRRNASVFFASNISEDDPFLIYATLASGPSCVFLSSDLMRDHVSNLDDPIQKKLFKHWQLSHQIYIFVRDDGEITFTGPLKHHIQIQGSMDSGWHIPYDDEFVLDPYEELNNWLCIQKKNKIDNK